MIIEVKRLISDDTTTVSTISLDGQTFCFGLEDIQRDTKVMGMTRIPEGEYNVGLRTEGGFHGRYSQKFERFHQGMLEVKDVPNFTHVLIHIGNTHKDTAGCLLVGYGAEIEPGRMRILSSTRAYEAFYKVAIYAANDNNLTIKYMDLDI